MEVLYYTGGNDLDKNTEQISYDEAEKLFIRGQKATGFEPICSAIFMDKGKKEYKVIYFKDGIIFIDLLSSMQIWYKKLEENTYFIDKIIINNYQYKQKHAIVELNFRNHTFSEPNICMVRVSCNGENEYYLGNIEETAFYRDIKWGGNSDFFS